MKYPVLAVLSLFLCGSLVKPTQAAPELALQIGQGLDSVCVNYSQDGRFLVSVGKERNDPWTEVKIWDTAGRGLWRTLSGPTQDITQAVFSRGSQLLVTSGTGSIVRLWDASSGRLLYSFPKIDLTIDNLAVSPDGRWLAAGTLARGVSDIMDARPYPQPGYLDRYTSEVRFWDLKARKPVGHLEIPKTNCVTVGFNSTGDQFAVTAADGISILKWPSRELKRKIAISSKYLGSPGFSPDSKWLAYAEDGVANVWSLQDATPPKTWKVASSLGSQAIFLPDNDTVIINAETNNSSTGLGWWSASTGKLLSREDSNDYPVNKIALSPDGQALATASAYGFLQVRNARTGKILMPSIESSPRSNLLVFSPDNKSLVSGNDDGTLRFWNLRSGRLDRTVNENTGYMGAVVFSQDGGQVYSLGGHDEKLQGWSLEKGSFSKLLEKPIPNNQAMAISSDRKLLATLGGEGSVRIWSAPKGNLVQYITGHRTFVTRACFTNDNKTVVSGSVDGTVKFWDLKGGICRLTLRIGEPVMDVAISKDGKYLATGGAKGSLRIWSAVSGKPLRTMPLDPNPINALTFTPEGHLLSANVKGTVRRWEPTTGKCFSRKAFPAGAIVAFSSDGRRMAVQDQQRQITQLFELRTGQPIVSFAPLPFDSSQDEFGTDVTHNWITYTPSGYYINSPGTENYIRWRDGNSLKPASVFSARFNRPEMIAQALKNH